MLKDLVGLAGVPFVVALTEAVKVVVPELPARCYPLVAIAWALALNLLAAYALGVPPLEAAVEGLAAGLAAAGLYSATKTALARKGAG
ncbi:MAG: hypothetical protein M0Z94_12665 [Dehalococcoidales bacterium]|nr:hypothetical protein [Dehalococcoidales bacterium]